MKKRIYLYKSGILRCQDSSLVYIVKNEKYYIPIIQTEIIYIFGNCTLNKSTIQILNEYDIKVYFFSYYGNYLGSYIPKKEYVGKIMIYQTMLYENKEELFNFQKEIIYTSILNMNAVLKYYHKKRNICTKQISELAIIIDEIKNLNCNNNILLILEARSKLVYYSSFNEIILNNDFLFTSRTSYPPKDEINALMSYGYAILYGIIETAIYTSNLLPQLGIIHGISKPGNSLKYDLADIFKPVLVDRLIFRLINKQQIRIKHFESKNNGIYLKKEGSKIFIEEFETLLTTIISLKNRKLSYRSIINREIYNLEKGILKKEKYNGYRMEW